MLAPLLNSYISNKFVDDSLKKRLELLSASEQDILLKTIDDLQPSANTLRELLRLLDEISARDGTGFAEVLKNATAKSGIFAEGMNRKDKQKKLRLYLEELRYPTIARIKGELSRCQSSIAKDLNLKVKFPEDLEGDSLSLTVSAKSEQGFLEIAENLKKMASTKELKQMFAVLKGEVE